MSTSSICRIYIVGMPASGKSTVGKKLARKLNYQFVDLDKMIEENVGLSIAEYMTRNGEDNFRLVEQEMLRKTFEISNVVVATGGGAACFFNNMNEINANGLSIYLEAPINLIISRLSQREQQLRPLISGKKNGDEQRNYLELLFEQRKIFYEKSKITFSALSVDIDEMVRAINS